MEVSTTQNFLSYSIELSDPLNPIIIEDIKYFPLNQVLNLEVSQLTINEDIQDLDITLFDYDVSTDSSGSTISMDSRGCGVRSGVSFGYRF